MDVRLPKKWRDPATAVSALYLTLHGISNSSGSQPANSHQYPSNTSKKLDVFSPGANAALIAFQDKTFNLGKHSKVEGKMRKQFGILAAMVLMTAPAMAFVSLDDAIILSRDEVVSRRVISEGSDRAARPFNASRQLGGLPDDFYVREMASRSSSSQLDHVFAKAGDVQRGVITVTPKEFYTGH
jgi:hypothetical protein